METLQIQPNDSVSINNLLALQKRGFSVMRSAHIGNLSPYNLTLADAGIPLLLVDHNVTGADKNYFPEVVLTQSGETRVAEDGTVTSRTPVGDGQFLDELHVAGISKALPNATIITNTEYLRQNEAVAGEIAGLAAQYFPEEFNRIVQPDGTTQQVDSAVDMLDRLGIMQLNDDPRAERPAVLMPNMLDIMVNFVVEALQSEKNVQYHVSGPDMIVYSVEKKRLEKLQNFYEVIKREASFADRLPRRLIVQLVPGSNARFATSIKNQPKLTDLFTQLDISISALATLATSRKEFFTSSARNNNQARRVFEAANSQQQFAYEQAIVEQAEQVPGLFVAQKAQKGFVTQYDVIQDNGLFVAPQNTELTFNELKALAKRLAVLRKKVTP